MSTEWIETESVYAVEVAARKENTNSIGLLQVGSRKECNNNP